DMPGNPGGPLRQSIEIGALFLGGGYIVRTRDRHDTGRDEQAKADGTVWESAERMPMAVLVNRASASAAEIVAAALQDNGRAAIVGERTYGKGSVQKSFDSPDGKTALKLTTERWLTPNGKNIHRWPESKETDDWGVRPDAGLEVKMTPEQIVQTILHQREAERIRPKGNGGAKPPADKPAPDKPADPPKKPAKVDPDQPEPVKLDPNFKDPVMEKALEYLRKKVAG
ncbi:MAG: S41 family peptidase, partial [Gemmataceae bacterium]